MSAKKRYLEHLKAKGGLPESYDCERMALGGRVADKDEWKDDEWNDHSDTSGEPMAYGDNYMEEYAFGGRIEAPEHGDQGKPEVSDEEVKHYLAQSLMRRKQLPGTRR